MRRFMLLYFGTVECSFVLDSGLKKGWIIQGLSLILTIARRKNVEFCQRGAADDGVPEALRVRPGEPGGAGHDRPRGGHTVPTGRRRRWGRRGGGQLVRYEKTSGSHSSREEAHHGTKWLVGHLSSLSL